MPDTFVQTYSPDRLSVTFGPLVISGFAKGSMVKVTRDGQQVTAVQGGDGRVARSVAAHDPLVAVEVQLLQTSEANELLGVMAETDRLTGLGVHPLKIVDLSGTTVYLLPQAWIAKRPDPEFGQEITNRTWTFQGAAKQREGLNL
jgi:hypothetical protein